jgi:hypothetical protein
MSMLTFHISRAGTGLRHDSNASSTMRRQNFGGFTNDDHPADHPFPFGAWCVADLALQHCLGLLPVQWIGSALGDCDCPAPDAKAGCMRLLVREPKLPPPDPDPDPQLPYPPFEEPDDPDPDVIDPLPQPLPA